MRIGLAVAMVVTGIALMGCGKKDRLYESTPVPQPAASAPSPPVEETSRQRPAVEREKVRLAQMTEAELTRQIIEAVANCRDGIDDESEAAVGESTEGEKSLHAELVR